MFSKVQVSVGAVELGGEMQYASYCFRGSSVEKDRCSLSADVPLVGLLSTHTHGSEGIYSAGGAMFSHTLFAL